MPLATIAEADAEYALNVGADNPARAWILSDRDVWYRNPAYTGPDAPHPEDRCYDDIESEDEVASLEVTAALKKDECSDLEHAEDDSLFGDVPF